ncbi:MAG: hypothetical protein JXA46_08305 [Dehalococcoidales bacterium]|nr:hypothetical protein [Dehalococcoidales bacterium]
MTTSTNQEYAKKLQAWRDEIQNRTGKITEQLFKERDQRVRDSFDLKDTDRIPLWLIAENNPRLGLPPAAAFYDPAAWKEALTREIINFEPDFYMAIMGSSGPSWEALGVTNKLWPGGPLPPDYEYQFVEKENMKVEEYDLFLSDPSDFIVRHFLPRVYNCLAPLSKLPPLSQMYGSFDFITTLFASPEFAEMAKALAKSGRELEKHRSAIGDAQADLASLGFPDMGPGGSVGFVPFDTVSSFFRGMKGSMLDMYRRPDKLIQACDTVLAKQIAAIVPADPEKKGITKRVGIPLWRGDCAFMSDEQFKKFYWPGFKKVLEAAIGNSYIPIPFFEARFGKRLEHLLELPKGKMAAVVEHMDIIPAMEMLGDHVCILGKPPVSLFYSSIQETKDYYRDLMKQLSKKRGLMLRIALPQSAPVEELKKMVEEIRGYCRC